MPPKKEMMEKKSEDDEIHPLSVSRFYWKLVLGQSSTLPGPGLPLVLNCLPGDIVKPELGITHTWVLLVKVALKTGQGILLTSVCRKPTEPTLISWCRCRSWAGQWVFSESPLKAT